MVTIVSFIIEHKASELIDVQTEDFKQPMTFTVLISYLCCEEHEDPVSGRVEVLQQVNHHDAWQDHLFKCVM